MHYLQECVFLSIIHLIYTSQVTLIYCKTYYNDHVDL